MHCRSVMITPINTYAPSLLKSLGFAGFSANGMMAPASVIGLIFSVSLAYSSDRTRERPMHIALAMALSGAGLLWLGLAPNSSSKWVLYGGYLLAGGTMATGQSINAAWMTSYLEDRTVRCI
jgi:MFS family permease